MGILPNGYNDVTHAEQHMARFQEPRMDSEGRREYTSPRLNNPWDKNGTGEG
jgi:hypothetical protein